jgi:hypothetical protein
MLLAVGVETGTVVNPPVIFPSLLDPIDKVRESF